MGQKLRGRSLCSKRWVVRLLISTTTVDVEKSFIRHPLELESLWLSMDESLAGYENSCSEIGTRQVIPPLDSSQIATFSERILRITVMLETQRYPVGSNQPRGAPLT